MPTWQGLDGFQRFLHPCALDGSSLGIGGVNPCESELLFCIKCLIPNCNWDYWQKSSTMLVMFDDLLKFWSNIVM